MSALHVVCPHCHTTNRVQSEDLGNAPDCGHCHAPLKELPPRAETPSQGEPAPDNYGLSSELEQD